MIIAEGGVKAIKFYKHLLLNRINWAEKDEGNRCKLVWEGTVENPSFGKWKQH
jgi:U4/U6 small nuclear ribonucleoprotein PRP3